MLGDVVRLVPLGPRRPPSFSIEHPYLEEVYLPLIGPTAVLLARSLGRALNEAGGPMTVSTVEVARQLGLRASSDTVVGRRSPLNQAFGRLLSIGLMQRRGPNDLGVHTAVPVVGDTALAKLPPASQAAHFRFLAEASRDATAVPGSDSPER